jgi:glycosyltransferase involved in cell wall biosynthesis
VDTTSDDQEMSAPIISIIVPAYNSEKFLRHCLDSVLNQSYRDTEVICVNDASTDRSLSIIHQYAASDPRVRVIDQPRNQGLSIARNAAMEIARGEYFLFVDADDYIQPDLCMKVVACAESSRADLVIFGYVAVLEDGTPYAAGTNSRFLAGVDPQDKHALLRMMHFACTKLIRAAKARELNLKFPDGLMYEDKPVHWSLVTRLDSIALLPEELYYSRQHPASITRRRDWRLTDIVVVHEKIREILNEVNLFETYRNVFLTQELSAYYTTYDAIDANYKPAFWDRFTARRQSREWQPISAHHSIDWRVRDFYFAAEGDYLAKIRRGLFLLTRSCYRRARGMIHR